MIVVDTDILIWIFRGDIQIVEKFKKTVIESNGHVFITPIQIIEIYSGMINREEPNTIKFLETLNTINIDREIGMIAGDFVKKYRKSHNVTIADAITGASAKINGYKIWTLNKKHYPMFSRDEFVQ